MVSLSKADAAGKRTIAGTHVFDGDAARAGYALNAMCFSFNDAIHRAEFAADPEAYMDRFALTAAQRQTVRDKDVLGMIAAGGNVYYLAKLAGIFGLNVQDLGALQTGMGVDDFKSALLSKSTTERSIAA